MSAAFLALVATVACNRSDPSTDRDPARSASAPAAARGDSSASTATAPSETAGASASASASSASALAGTWEGTYDAKKGSVEMPKKVKDPARSKDDGKAASGHGTITITISPSGDVSGTGKGAL